MGFMHLALVILEFKSWISMKTICREKLQVSESVYETSFIYRTTWAWLQATKRKFVSANQSIKQIYNRQQLGFQLILNGSTFNKWCCLHQVRKPTTIVLNMINPNCSETKCQVTVGITFRLDITVKERKLH